MTAARWCRQAREAMLGPEMPAEMPKALTKQPRLRRRRRVDALLIEAASQAEDDYAPEAPEATTLEDIGFDGDIVHASAYTCHVVCNDAAHVGGGSDFPTHHFSTYTRPSYREPERPYIAPVVGPRIEQPVRRKPADEGYRGRYGNLPDPQKVTGLIKNREGFRKYLARTMEHPPEPWTEHFRDMWIWFNKPQADGISPNDELRLDSQAIE